MAEKTHLPNPFHLAHAISNIQTLIPVKLDIKNPNNQIWSFFSYYCWSLCSYRSSPRQRTPSQYSPGDWTRGDYLLQSWIYSTISTDLSSMIFSKTASAPELWNSLASLFTDNQDYRAIQLEEHFKSLKKGRFC